MNAGAPSSSLVDDVSRSISDKLKNLSRDMKILNSSKTSISGSSIPDIDSYERLLRMKSLVSELQKEMEALGSPVGGEVQIPETVTVTSRELNFLNAIFMEYVRGLETSSATV